MKNPWIGWMVFIAALLIPHGAWGQTLVLQGGTLIDGTGKAPVNNAVVVIQGNRIQAVGAAGQVAVPPNARVIKTDGRYILPGLIDGHVHLYADYAPEMYLRYGITTIVDLNNDTNWSLLQRDDLRSGRIKGPRLFISGEAANGPTMVTNNRPGSSAYTQDRVLVMSLRNVQEAREYVRKMKALGVDCIKTDYSLTLDQVAAIVDEANKVGLPVVGHSQNILQVSAVGEKYMEHTNTLGWAILNQMGGQDKVREGGANPERLMDMNLLPAVVKTLVERGVYVNPTFIARWRNYSPRRAGWSKEGLDALKDPVLASMVDEESKKAWEKLGSPDNPALDVEGYKKVQEFVRQYAAAGGKLVVGTDEEGENIPGLSVDHEMEMFTDADVPPMKAIQAATLWAAESIWQDKNIGSVEPGKFADITVIEGNPLNDITATKNVRMVIKDGQVLDTTYDPKAMTKVPRPFGLVPVLTSINPPMTWLGSGEVTLQVEGVRFSPKSVVHFDTTELKTQFVSSTKLTATVDSRLLQNPGSYNVFVLNPGASGGASNGIYLLVDSK
jgi:imidazolonepropionase-like amidohydrolase